MSSTVHFLQQYSTTIGTNITHPDVLSQFTPGQKITPSSLSSPPPPPPPPRLDTHEEELDFARELAKGMEDLMRELSADAEGKTSTDNGGSSDARALKSTWEQMLVEGMGNNPGIGRFSGNEASTGGGGFQDKIKQAVNKLKESESNLQVNFNLFFIFEIH